MGKKRAEIADRVTGIGWASKQEACVYASVSGRTMSTWLANGLPHSRIGGCLRIRYADLDAYLISHRVGGSSIDLQHCSRIAADLVEGLQ